MKVPRRVRRADEMKVGMSHLALPWSLITTACPAFRDNTEVRSEKSLGRQRCAVDQILSDCPFLVADRIVRRQRAGVAPMPIEIGRLLGRGGAADIEQQSAVTDRRVVGNDLGLRGQQR